METVKPTICKPLVSILFSQGKDKAEFDYRMYLICKYEFYRSSGIFTIDQLMNELNRTYGFKTLHHLPGNNRSKYRIKLHKQLSKSLLFKEIGQGKFKYIPEKKIIGNQKYEHCTRLNITKEELSGRKTFNNMLIGALSSGNSLKSYNTLSKQTGYTGRKCFQACKENHVSGKVIKQNNYIIVKTSRSKFAVSGERNNLLFSNGISTPEPVKYKGEWCLLLYAPNSYRVSLTTKPTKQKQTLSSSVCGYLTPFVKNKNCRYVVVDHRSSLYSKIPGVGLFSFKNNTEDYHTYILENTDYNKGEAYNDFRIA